MTTVLDRICADKQAHVERMKTQSSLSLLEQRAKEQTPPRGFINALRACSPAFITEVKKASPSKGVIREDFDAVSVARIYAANGASCLSVLTDEPYFQGKDEYLTAIRGAVSLPLLRKDFMIDPYQIVESRALGADCILLIMAALSDAQAKEFYDLARGQDMDVLVEVHDAVELDRALLFSPAMIGVNNRNLKTLDVSLQTGLDLGRSIPDTVVKVAESGISSPGEITRFAAVGYTAFLVGESLMREADIGVALRKLQGQS